MEVKALLVDSAMVDSAMLAVPPLKQYCSHCHERAAKSWKIKYCISCMQKLKRWLQEIDEKCMHLGWHEREQ